jgi:MFS family permease
MIAPALLIKCKWDNPMSRHHPAYFSILTGSASGLLAWGAASLAAMAAANRPQEWISDALILISLGVILGPLLFLFLDHVSGSRFLWQSLGLGLLFGGVFAVAATATMPVLREKIASESPILYRLAAWVFASSVIALGLGLRWVRSNRTRVLHTYAGGLVGGLLGGLLFAGPGAHAPEICQAFGLMLTGAGTSFGAALSPLVLAEGALQFISSGDARAQSKYGRANRQWSIEQGESYVLGNMATSQTGTRFQPGADVFIPDASLAPRHAVIFGKDGRFYIARHPDAGGPAGVSRFVLRVRGRTVTSSQLLNDSDDLLVGKTALRFAGRRPGAA